MRIEDVDEVAAALEGVRRAVVEGCVEWRYRGRLVARQLDDEQLVLRCSFDARDALVRTHPTTFSVPRRYEKHMMVVADLRGEDTGAIEDAFESAWLLQRQHVPFGRR